MGERVPALAAGARPHRALSTAAPVGAGGCAVCGHEGEYVVTGAPTRESHECPACRASLRYRLQARVIADLHGDADVPLAELVEDPDFRRLDVYEPGLIGPFREHLRALPGYVSSYFWPDVELGDEREGVRCEDLRNLTFEEESFDLVISSDIFEHVRGPEEAFAGVFRVLRPHGWHVFTVPLAYPFEAETRPRVDYSGPEDVHLLPPEYHGSPHDPAGSLVYTDFGMDLPDALRELGFETFVHHGFRMAVTFASRRLA